MLVISLIIIWNFFVSSIVKVTPAFYFKCSPVACYGIAYTKPPKKCLCDTLTGLVYQLVPP